MTDTPSPGDAARALRITGVIFIGALALIGISCAMSSQNYGLNWDIIAGGGGAGASSSYKIQGTAGLIGGVSGSTNFRMQGGFWGPFVTTPLPIWTSPGGSTLNSVAMDAKSSAGEWFAVVRGTDNHIYVNRHTSTTNSWSGWSALGGTTNDEPAVAYTGNNMVHVVIRGSDNSLYTKRLNLSTNTWDASWMNLGGHTSSAPTPISVSSAQIPGDPAALPWLWLAIRGTDNHLYVKRWTPTTGWESGYQSWGGTTSDRPALALSFNPATGNGILTLGVRGVDNKVYRKDYTFSSGGAGSLGSWTAAGGSTLSPPVIRYKDGILRIVLRGTDNHLYCKSGTNSYTFLGGTTMDMPAVYSWPERQSFEISIRGTDSRVYHDVLNPATNQWTGWTSMQGSTASHPTFSRGTGTNGVLAIRGMDNKVYVREV